MLALVGSVLSATIVSYAFARFRFPGRDIFFFVTLSTMMLPIEVTLIPQYLLFKEFGWIDTWYPLMVPWFFGGGAFNIFLMRQFMMSIPFDLDEAAKIDGANSWQILWRIIVPLCKPAMATLATLGFITNWNNFLGPLIFLNTEIKYTVDRGSALLPERGGGRFGSRVAAAGSSAHGRLGDGGAAVSDPVLRGPAVFCAGHRDYGHQGLMRYTCSVRAR